MTTFQPLENWKAYPAQEHAPEQYLNYCLHFPEQND